ncbi:MAG: heme ABC transporter permease CcmC [Candidatus Accumulibacter sp.]|jgi:heme exporter protein C|nr:heme ABC transporter permease CcmC [Accumulibacter sp.]
MPPTLPTPRAVYLLAGRMIPWFWALAAVFGIAGLAVGFFIAPVDARQGEGYRIIFLHVPVSWMSMFLYLAMAFWAGLGLAFGFRLSGTMARALAPTGALFTFLSLWTGALWGKPMWGTWWVWGDARLVSELILLFLYAGFIALQSAIDDPRRADRAGAILALVGVVNIPIIYFSVQWWNTLHQGPSVRLGGSSMAASMFWGILLCALACSMYAAAVSLMRARRIMLEREKDASWVREELGLPNERRNGT